MSSNSRTQLKAKELLEKLNGDRELFSELAKKFLVRVKDYNLLIDSLYESKDFKKLQFESHSLKCEAQNFIEGEFISSLQKIEKSSGVNDCLKIEEAINNYKDCFKLIEESIAELEVELTTLVSTK